MEFVERLFKAENSYWNRYMIRLFQVLQCKDYQQFWLWYSWGVPRNQLMIKNNNFLLLPTSADNLEIVQTWQFVTRFISITNSFWSKFPQYTWSASVWKLFHVSQKRFADWLPVIGRIHIRATRNRRSWRTFGRSRIRCGWRWVQSWRRVAISYPSEYQNTMHRDR